MAILVVLEKVREVQIEKVVVQSVTLSVITNGGCVRMIWQIKLDFLTQNCNSGKWILIQIFWILVSVSIWQNAKVSSINKDEWCHAFVTSLVLLSHLEIYSRLKW